MLIETKMSQIRQNFEPNLKPFSFGKSIWSCMPPTSWRLADAGPTIKWEKMSQALSTERYLPTAFLIPDEFAKCQ